MFQQLKLYRLPSWISKRCGGKSWSFRELLWWFMTVYLLQMKSLVFTITSVLFVTFLAAPGLGAGWAWDIGNGMGFVAFSGLLYLSKIGGSARNVRAHQLLGYVVLGGTVMHVYWFLVLDAAVIEYVKPGAPLYMWTGIAGFLMLFVLIFIGLPEYRLRLHKRYALFKSWHLGLALFTIMGAGHHIVASGFYLREPYQVALFVLLVAIVLFGDSYLGKREAETRQSSWVFIGLGIFCVAVFAGIRNVRF